MIDRLKKLPVAFFRSSHGTEPVREWLQALSRVDRQIIGLDLARAEFCWPVGMPLCKALGKGLWEIRSNLTQGRIARVVFCVADGHMMMLHGFIKKTQKMPHSDLELALHRKKEIEHG